MYLLRFWSILIRTKYILILLLIQVYLLKNDKKVSKKKTSTKRIDSSPIYNEAMIFSVPPYMLGTIQLRLTVVNVAEVDRRERSTTASGPPSGTIMSSIGHVFVGSKASGKGLRHWNQMLTSLRKPIAMWHTIRQNTMQRKYN